MKTGQAVWKKERGWQRLAGMLRDGDAADLVLAFGSPDAMLESGVTDSLGRLHPGAYVCGCSTAGEIQGGNVTDGTLVATAVKFDTTQVRVSQTAVPTPDASYDAGHALASSIPHEGLVHAFVLADGLAVNGSELVRGLSKSLPSQVVVTGGLSGDGARFKETCVLVNGSVTSKEIVLVGFYGDRLKVGFGSMGGWDQFGPERRITKSKGNVLYELDGRSALDLYKEYLREHVKDLPASALLFPLAIRATATDNPVVRTVLAVDEAEKSMTFAGDMPEGQLARLMRANFDRLLDGAGGAAKGIHSRIAAGQTDLAILISCVGRKLVLKQRIEEEVERVLEVLGPATPTAGFYSYGEISPFTPDARCALHNQTMTITTFSER